MRAEDEQSFEAFVGRVADRLLRGAVLLVGDRGIAEDLVQSALERTYRHWPRVASGNPEAYVRRAIVNAAISRWRRKRFLEQPLDAGEAGAPRMIHVDDPADRIDLRDQLVRALRTLPARQRAVLVLRYLDDLSEAETADVLGCSIGSVKSQASRGLARLRDSAVIAAATSAAGTKP